MNPMFDRNFTLAAIVVCLPFAGAMLYNGVSDPLKDERAWLRAEMAQATVPGERAALKEDGNWQDGLARRPGAWTSITREPPPPPPPPPEKPQEPNVREMLKEVYVTRAQIGDKIRVISPNAPRGEWLVVGAAINGCVLTSFDKESATFSYEWKEGRKTINVKIPRE
ncbi:MAG: hypothetical protein RLZZ303_29 [Candidatus Hydrogenedentota bacterium]|jgi:hypothetical protein